MSFDYNPYEHIEIVTAPVTDDQWQWRWHCHGCGADSNITFAETIGLGPLVAHYRAHLLHSHKRTPEDFNGWSKH